MTEQTTTGIDAETLSEKFLTALKKTWADFEGTIALSDKINASLQVFSQITEDAAEAIIKEKLKGPESDNNAKAKSVFLRIEHPTLSEGMKTTTLCLTFTNATGSWDKTEESAPEVIFEKSSDQWSPNLNIGLDSAEKVISFSSRGTHIDTLNQAEFLDEKFDDRMLRCFEETIFPWVNSNIKFADAKDYMRILSAPATVPTDPQP